MLYNRIAVLRSERSLSRQALALEVGVNPQTIGFLERGDYTPSLELAFKISRFFKLPADGLSNTLRAGTDGARGAFTSPRPIHFAYPRCITVREMARLPLRDHVANRASRHPARHGDRRLRTAATN